MSRPWTSYQFPHYPSHGASSYAHTTQPIVYNPPPVSNVPPPQSAQRPGYTGMSYSGYSGYSQYVSGAATYGQLAQQNSPQVSAHTSRASSVQSRHSATPTPHPLSEHTATSTPTIPQSDVPLPSPAPQAASQVESQNPQSSYSMPPQMSPQPRVVTQFRVTTPASFSGQTNELQWQVPFIAPH